MLTPDKLKEAAAALRILEAAYESLRTARHRLNLVNRFAKTNGGASSRLGWPCEIILEKDTSYRNQHTTISVRIPFPMVQQQVVDELNAAIRQVVLLGGDPTSAESE